MKYEINNSQIHKNIIFCYCINIQLFILILLFSSCKYEDGPGISLRSACKRVEGNYTIDKFEVNNHDSLSVFISRNCNGKIDFLDDNKILGNLLIYSCRYSGATDLRDGGRKISIQFDGNTSNFKMGIEPWEQGITHTWDVSELKDKSMTFETTYNGNFIKIRLIE